jgi:ParB family chromosome partitioning protein
MTEVIEISLEKIQFSKDMIREIDGTVINDLRESIKRHGVLQPILVRPLDNGTFEVVFGHHRVIAAKGAELKTIPAQIKTMSKKDSLLLSISENVQRLEMNPMKEGEVYSKLYHEYYGTTDQRVTHHGLKWLAEDVGKSVNYIRGRISLYEKLVPELKDELGKNLTISSAISISKLPKKSQVTVFKEIEYAKEGIKKEYREKKKNLLGGGYGAGSWSNYCTCPKCGGVHEKGRNYKKD